MYRGIAQDGCGDASRAMTHERCRRMVEIQKALGYMPFPGSLNMTLDKPFDYSQPHIEADLLNPKTNRDWTGDWKPATFRFWPIKVNGVACHAVLPKGKTRPELFLEVYAPVRLRDHGKEFSIAHAQAGWKVTKRFGSERHPMMRLEPCR